MHYALCLAFAAPFASLHSHLQVRSADPSFGHVGTHRAASQMCELRSTLVLGDDDGVVQVWGVMGSSADPFQVLIWIYLVCLFTIWICPKSPA